MPDTVQGEALCKTYHDVISDSCIGQTVKWITKFFLNLNHNIIHRGRIYFLFYFTFFPYNILLSKLYGMDMV